MSSSISFPMSAFGTGGMNRWGAGRWPSSGGTRVDQVLKALERTRTADVNLQIKTDEGDTVTISLHSELDQLAVSYRSKSRGPEGREGIKLRLNSTDASQDMTVQVDGSLNEQEQADVNELIDMVKAHVQDFFANGGSLEAGSLSNAGADGSLDSLAGFQLDESSSETVNAMVVRMRTWQAPVPVSTVPADPASEPGVADAKAATVTPLPAARPVAEGAEAGAPAATPADPATTLFARTSALLDAISQLIAAWKEQLGQARQPISMTPDPATQPISLTPAPTVTG